MMYDYYERKEPKSIIVEVIPDKLVKYASTKELVRILGNLDDMIYKSKLLLFNLSPIIGITV